MPGVELQNLSSNWKNLQKSLSKDKTTPTAPNPLKRKTTSDGLPVSHSNGVKRKKLETRDIQSPVRRRRMMGSYPSKEPPVQPKPAASPSASLALFAEDNDIPAADVAAAYKLDRVKTAASTPASTSTPQQDALNSGLNPAAVPGKYIALDCEMVGTGPPPATDSVLARVSLVNYHGQLLYDSYVLPPPNVAITDYRTFVSGIQPHHLRPGTARPFRHVQRDVAALLAGRVLVGHALKNDLAVLVLA
ncbi:3'-5' exonuclease, partial [Cryomyces antarcticus]